MIIVALISVSAFAVYGSTAQAKSNNPFQNRLEQLKDFAQRFSFMHSFNTGFATIQSTATNNSRQVFYLQIMDSGYPTILTAQLNATVDPNVDYVNKSADWVSGLLSARYLVEYTDNNSDGMYNPGNDTALQTVNLSTLTWTLGEASITQGSTSGYNITLSANYKGATIEIIAQLYNTGVTLSNGIPVSPSEVKVDFIFNSFPWTTNTSRLALISAFGGISGSVQVTRTDNETDAIAYKNAFAYFTWGSTATVDGKTVNVVAYQNDTNALHLVELNYPQGASIVHDPIIGVGSGSVQDVPSLAPSPTTSVTSALPGLYFIVATAVVVAGAAALTLFARKRMVEPKLQF